MGDMAEYYRDIGYGNLCDYGEEPGETWGRTLRRRSQEPFIINAPKGVWCSRDGEILIKNMSISHIENVLRKFKYHLADSKEAELKRALARKKRKQAKSLDILRARVLERSKHEEF